MSDVHKTAAVGFDRAAKEYERARPGYPPEAIDFVVSHVSGLVVDLAAGTGKLTRELVARGLDVIAVEPVAAMRAQFRESVPGVPILAGTAEAMPFDDHSIGAITAAQAAHWFDAARAVAEFHRVVRRGGRVVLIWNVRDERVDWVRRVTEIIDPLEQARGVPRYKHGAWRPPFEQTPLLRSVGEARFEWGQPVTPVSFLERFESCSFIAVLDDAQRAQVLDRLKVLLESHPDLKGKTAFEHPYLTEVYVYEAV